MPSPHLEVPMPVGDPIGNHKERRRMAADGYQPQFECTYGGAIPSDLDLPAGLTGWEIRRRLKAWCERHAIVDYIIFRATDYVKDLHGSAVYELWVNRISPTTEHRSREP